MGNYRCYRCGVELKRKMDVVLYVSESEIYCNGCAEKIKKVNVSYYYDTETGVIEERDAEIDLLEMVVGEGDGEDGEDDEDNEIEWY